jgi:hypothetical protein
MLLHSPTGGEGLLAEVARIRSLASVGANVNLQQTCAVELLVAEFAVVLLLALHLSGVSAKVLAQIVLAAEHAAAHLTWVGRLGLSVAARLDNVSLQVIFATEHFVAAIASVRFQT